MWNIKITHGLLNTLQRTEKEIIFINHYCFLQVRANVLNVTFNNILVISWWPVLVGGHWSVCRKPPTFHKSLTNFITSPWVILELTTVVVIGSDCIVTTKLQLHYVILTTKLQLHYVIPTTKLQLHYAIPTTKLQLHYVILTTKLLHYVIPTIKL